MALRAIFCGSNKAEYNYAWMKSERTTSRVLTSTWLYLSWLLYCLRSGYLKEKR
jgi:hypothetical protein